MLKWLTCFVLGVFVFQFNDAKATPSLTYLLLGADGRVAVTVLIDSKKKGGTTSPQNTGSARKKSGIFICPVGCLCGCRLGFCIPCVNPKAKTRD